MKRFVAIILTLMMVLSLCACGEKSEAGKEQEEKDGNTVVSGEIDRTEPYSIEEPLENPVVILDNEHVTVTVTARFERGFSQGYRRIGYIVLLENKTDKDIHFVAMDVCGNGFMLSAQEDLGEVPAGMKANGELAVRINAESSLEPFYTIEELEVLEGDIVIFKDTNFTDWGGYFNIS